MSTIARSISAGALAAIALCVPVTSAAQVRTPAHVRVVTKSERILRWLGPVTDVILVADEGTTFEVLDFDQDKGWFWIVLPPDLHGSRKVGWIRASSVEAADGQPSSPAALPVAPSEAQRDEAQPAALAATSTSTPPVTEDKVTMSIGRDTAAASPADAAGAKKPYKFEDVHFERDSFSLGTEDLERLRVAAAALKDDPSLVMTIEGHTCNLGSAPYNLALGNRRASAVKEYLVSAGVPADRLLTVSQGEAHAEFDNSREETRRLNRRVALVPKIPR